MVSESLRFPLQGDDALQTIVIGGLLSILSVLFVPALFVQGYLVRVLRAGVRDEPEPPAFDDWGGLLLDGIKVLAIQVGYLAVPTVVFLVAVLFVGVGVAGATGDSGLLAGIGIVGGLLLLVALLLTIVAAYLLPAALTNFAHEGSLAAAFDLSRVADAAFSIEYAVSLVLAVVVALVLGLVALPLLFLLVGFLVQFYAQVVTFHIVARGFAKSVEAGQHGEDVMNVPPADIGE